MNATVVVIFISNRTADDVDGETEQPLDAYPLILMSSLMVLRCVIIAVRYATTHTIILDDMHNGQMSAQSYKERLLSLSWITMAPDTILNEIEMGMIRVGANDKFFKFKTLTPLYPTMFGKLTDPNYWDDEIWSQPSMVKKERKELKELGKSMRIFKNNAHLKKEDVIKKYKKLPENFSLSYDYLKKLVLENKNFDFDA